jgi:hypothetical protein
MSDEIINQQTTFEKLVTFKGNAFSGYATSLRIVKYDTWSEVSLRGGGRSGPEGDAVLIERVPISVLKRIIEIHDQLK